MSQIMLRVDDNRTLVYGDDPPFGTYFLQLYEGPTHQTDFDAVPVKAAGYHPSEQLLDPGPDYGPYPLTMGGLDRCMQEWGLSDDVRDEVGRGLARSGAELRF